MTEKQEIANWLNKSPRPFNEGLMLHLAYLQDKTGNRLIERTRDEAKLYQLLRARYYQLPNQESHNVATPSPQASPITAPADELPQDIKDGWFQLKTEQERWHAEMSLIGAGKAELTEAQREQRATLALLIYNREEQLEQFGTAINHFKKYGRLPEGFSIERKTTRKKLPKMKEAEAKLYIKNKLAPNISKLKKKISEAEQAIGNATGKVLLKKQKQIGQWQTQLRELSEQKQKLENA